VVGAEDTDTVVLVLAHLEMVEQVAAAAVLEVVVQMVGQEIHLVYRLVKVIVAEVLLAIQLAAEAVVVLVLAVLLHLMLMVPMEVMVLHHHTQAHL
jgi:hypothetical protein